MAWYHRLFNLARSERHARDVEREMAFHLSERTDDLVASGMTEPDARREAGRRFGNRTVVAERTRDVDLMTWLESLLGDIRYAWRTLLASPGFALVAIISLGLGIGANTAIFSIIDAVMLKSLPVNRPEQLVRVTYDAEGRGDSFTNPIWEAIRERATFLSGAFAYSVDPINLASSGEVRRVTGSRVSGEFFPTLGVRPIAGRMLSPADDVRGCPAISVVSAGFADSEFGGPANAVGKRLSVDGHPFEVVGVAERRFDGIDTGNPVAVYVPLCAEDILSGSRESLDSRSRWFLHIIGRVKDGITVDEAARRFAAMAPAVYAATEPMHWGRAHREEYLRRTLHAASSATGRSVLAGSYRRPLVILMEVVAVVLVIACGNVANLLLARSAVRQREIAVRLAIGAGRGRIVRQLMTESLLLALLGAAAGVLLANWGSHLLVSLLSTTEDPVSLNLSIDLRVLGFTIAVAVATGVLFGLAPAWRAARVAPQTSIRASGRAIVEGHSRFNLGKALVTAQIALSLMLVVGAGLLVRTFQKLESVDPGFSANGVLLVSVDHAASKFEPERQRAVHTEILDRLRSVPGVQSAGSAVLTPISGSGWNGDILVDGFTPARERDDLVWFNEVSDQFFSTMEIGFVTGRDFTNADRVGGGKVAVINETMARRFFGEASPLGKVFREKWGDKVQPPIEVVGVVRDSKYESLREATYATAYYPASQNAAPNAEIVYTIRTGSTAAVVPAVKGAIAAVNPAAALELTTLRTQIDESLNHERLLATLSGFFGVLALLVAAIGLYGMMAYSVTRRRNEIGIRVALGAERSTLLRMILGEVGQMTLTGIVLGAIAARAGAKLLAVFLFGLEPSDPTTLALSALTLLAASGVAGLLPAWRASRLDPMVALRED
jgi:putative ABC transport system permease protein